MRKVVTSHIYPPIPVRDFDWAAHYDDPEGPSGWGKTEQAAINDLVENHPPCREKWGYADWNGECLLCSAASGESCRLPSK
jgi:hypothetical protein